MLRDLILHSRDSLRLSGIKALLANGLSTFFVKGKPVFNDGPLSLPKNPPDCPFLHSWVFDNFILTDELFAKALKSLETCILVNYNLCGNWGLSL